MIAGHLRLVRGYWRMCLSYYDTQGKRIFISETTHLKEKGNKKRAEEMLLDLRRKYTVELQIQTHTEGISFDEYMENWLGQIKPIISPSTFSSYSYIVKSSICPYFKPFNLSVSKIEPRHITEYYAGLMNRGLSATTVRRHHANIHKALNQAVDAGLIPTNPADRVTLPRQQAYSAAFYTAKECQVLLNSAQNTKMKFPIMLALLLGLRRSEALGLKWEAIDFDSHVLHVCRAVHYVRGNTVEREILKRKSSHRTLPMPEVIENTLMSVRKETGYVCVDSANHLLSPNALSQGFKDLLRANNLREIRFHDLRHTCAALLLTAHMPLFEVSRWLGHSTLTITADLYGHLEFSSKLQCASVLSDTLTQKGDLNEEL